MLDLDISQILTQAVGFLILLVVFKLFFWKPVLSLLDQRKEKIASELKRIEELKEASARMKAEYEARLSAVEEEARERIRQAIEEGRKIGEEIKASAQKEAAGIIENARSSARQEFIKTKAELKTHIVDLAMKATESIVLERLTAEHDKKLVEDFLEKIDKA